MRSPTSSEDSRLVRIVPCAQTRLRRPRGHRDAFSSSSAPCRNCSGQRLVLCWLVAGMLVVEGTIFGEVGHN